MKHNTQYKEQEPRMSYEPLTWQQFDKDISIGYADSVKSEISSYVPFDAFMYAIGINVLNFKQEYLPYEEVEFVATLQRDLNRWGELYLDVKIKGAYIGQSTAFTMDIFGGSYSRRPHEMIEDVIKDNLTRFVRSIVGGYVHDKFDQIKNPRLSLKEIQGRLWKAESGSALLLAKNGMWLASAFVGVLILLVIMLF